MTVARMSDQEAFETLKRVRWAHNSGKPCCPRCRCDAIYTLRTRGIWKCQSCLHQFSVTSSTIFSGRKLPIRTYLMAIAIFAMGSKGHSALQLSRDLDIQYRSAFVLLHKLRHAISREIGRGKVTGRVEVDGAYFGGYIKPANYKKKRKDRREAATSSGKRRVVVVLRERGGKALTIVAPTERGSLPELFERISLGSIVYADDSTAWSPLHGVFDTRRINHSECYSDGKACTNQAESFFSRLRRAEIGTHHHISRLLPAYAAEMAWRENNRRDSTIGRYQELVSLALRAPAPSPWTGYWQRRRAAPTSAASTPQT